MHPELYWLGVAVIVTALLWLPYILNSFVVRGIWPTLGYAENMPRLSPWAERAKKAHYNAVENLVIFAPVVVGHAIVGTTEQNATVATAATIYVAARVVHYLVYVAAIPVARTLSFATGWAVTLYLAFELLGRA
jgi:uncharacterized MAPEG superfamily protein